MVNVDIKKCIGCGLCADICHENCMELINGKIRIKYDLCSTCTQCIAICPQLALSWDNVAPVPFKDKLLPSPDNMNELLKQRKTIRYFKKIKPDKKLIEEIINYGAYAPAHSHDYRVVAVNDENVINLIDGEIFKTIKLIYNLFFKPSLVRIILNLMPAVYRNEFSKAKPKLEKCIKLGKAYPNKPPVLIFVIGDRRSPLENESAQYIIYNMDLYSRTLGIGCRNLVGNQMFINKIKRVRKIFGMTRNERIFGTIGLGYPAKNFRNKVNGRKLNIKWC